MSEKEDKKKQSSRKKKHTSRESRQAKPKIKTTRYDGSSKSSKKEEPSSAADVPVTMSDFMLAPEGEVSSGPVPPGISEFVLPGTMASKRSEGTSELSAAYSLAFDENSKSTDLIHSTEPIPPFGTGKGSALPPGSVPPQMANPPTNPGMRPPMVRTALPSNSPPTVHRTADRSSSSRRSAPSKQSEAQSKYAAPEQSIVSPQSTLSSCGSLSLIKQGAGGKTSIAGSAIVLSNEDLIKEQARQAARKAGIELDEPKSDLMMNTGSGMDASLIKHFYDKQNEHGASTDRRSQEGKDPPDKS